MFRFEENKCLYFAVLAKTIRNFSLAKFLKQVVH